MTVGNLLDSQPVQKRPLPKRASANLLRALFEFARLLPVLLAIGCGTKAVGMTECRDIEFARCQAGVSCGLVRDVEACKQHYQDHCLHGLAVDDVPRQNKIKDCVDAITAAGTCAKRHGRKATPKQCGDDFSDSDAKRICDIVDEPEQAAQCTFLIPDPEEKPKDEEKSQDSGSKKADSDAG
jgi:hypothetical protein